jgi:hypothetical protein
MYQEGTDNWSRDWSSVTASLPGPSPGGRNSWNWIRWPEQAAQWLAHQRSHIGSRRSCPRHQPACNSVVSGNVSESSKAVTSCDGTSTKEPGRYEGYMGFVTTSGQNREYCANNRRRTVQVKIFQHIRFPDNSAGVFKCPLKCLLP